MNKKIKWVGKKIGSNEWVKGNYLIRNKEQNKSWIIDAHFEDSMAIPDVESACMLNNSTEPIEVETESIHLQQIKEN